jgi:hypothetical protein
LSACANRLLARAERSIVVLMSGGGASADQWLADIAKAANRIDAVRTGFLLFAIVSLAETGQWD